MHRDDYRSGGMDGETRMDTAEPIADRVARLDWPAMAAELDARGVAVARGVLAAPECAALSRLYDQADGFRSRVVMARHGYGQGEYRYFDYPLPATVQVLRAALYSRLAPVANRWREVLGQPADFPTDHAAYLDHCHRAGQTRPTPLLLRYGPGDYNRLHQDLYGEHVFPLQAVILLSAPGRDFEGGELVLVEQTPRMQSRAEVIGLGQGDAAIFAVRERPARGSRGHHRVVMRHAVSRLHRGARTTLGIIFHDAA
jgi:uncharacterized protein